MSIYGYCRISSKKQIEGFGLEVQKKDILEKYENALIFEEQFSAKTKDRPIFKKVLDELKENDTLVVAKLDRLARNTIEGIQIVEGLFSRKVSVHVLNVGLLENTHMGKFFLTTLLAVAEMERNTIVERTQAGLEIARLNHNFIEGRPPKFTKNQLDWSIDLLKNNTYRVVATMTGISLRTLKREMAKRNLRKDDL